MEWPWLLVLALSALIGRPRSAAALEERSVRYTVGAQLFEGFVVLPSSESDLDSPDSDGTTVPGILIAHQWMGLGATERTRARELAQQGFVAFALDMYGVGCRDRPCGPDTMAELNADPAELRRRCVCDVCV